MIPSGTPTPAPIATSCELLDATADEDGEEVVELAVTVVVEFVESELVSVTLTSAARSRMMSASSKRKLSPYGQTISDPL
jgi:hypothetical protein